MNISASFLTRIFFLGLLQIVAGFAAAKDTGTDNGLTVEREIRAYTVNSDGSFVLDMQVVLLINEARAVAGAAQRSIGYNRTLDSLEILEAYTQKRDGRRVTVRPDQIRDQQEARSAGAPMFQDTRVTAVIYPEVAVGDRIVLHFRKTRKTAMFPGHFEDLETPSFFKTGQYTLIYDMPDGMALHADARGFRETIGAGAPGRRRYQWDYQPGERQRIERGSVAYIDYGDRIAVSTFPDFRSFGSAYEARARDKAAVTDKIRSLAQKLTAGINDPREKALALANWVRRNIRYVAVYVGAGGVVPHAAQDILDNRYGDCKDHVVLLEAMLSAVGIDSTAALVNLGNSYRLPSVPVLGVMNHVITYIPQLDLYLDSTASQFAAGYLPVPLLDKPVLLTRSGQLARTPADQQGEMITRSQYRIHADGKADFTVSSTLRGWHAETTRYVMRAIKTSDYGTAVERMLLARGQRGSGTLELGALTGSGDEYQMRVIGTSANMLNLPGPIGITSGATLSNDIGQWISAFASENERSQDYLCTPRQLEEVTEFLLPPEIAVLAMPKPVSLQDAHFTFSANYTRQDNMVVVRRSLDFRHRGAVCDAAEYRSMQPALEQITKDLRSQIIVQQN